jgi:reverse transcriptase-like protein
LVVDYRYVNSVMVDEGYQLPATATFFVQLRGCRYFTLVDLNWGFWNVRLPEENKKFTGFVVPGRDVFVWNVLPFGLKISPTVFQRAIEMALRELIDEGKAQVYVDDIVVATFDFIEHLTTLRRLFAALLSAGFYINFSKMKLLQKEILLLGHVVSFNQVRPDPAKIQGLLAAQPPRTKADLASLHAAASFLRCYIPNFAAIMEPMTALLAKQVKYEWTEKQQEAFEAFREALISAVTLTMPDFTLPFIIFTDASTAAVGAILMQSTREGRRLTYHCICLQEVVPY